MSADKLTDEQILAVPELVTRFTATHRPPADSIIAVSVRNYDGQTRHPSLRGLDVRVSVTTADATYVAELVTRLFGTAAEPDSEDDYGDVRVTRWRDTLDVGLDWTRPKPAPRCQGCSDVLDDESHPLCPQCADDVARDYVESNAYDRAMDR